MSVKTRDILLVSMFAALISICSWLTVPGPVPFTMQTFGVLATVGLLGGSRGSRAVLVYIILGAVGLPVFSGFGGGLGVLLGPLGGYIFGFLLTALVMWAVTARFGFGLWSLLAAMLLGVLVCYAMGLVWFLLAYAGAGQPLSLRSALSLCVLPFLLPDAVKLALALSITLRLRRSGFGSER